MGHAVRMDDVAVAAIIDKLAGDGWTIATAESLTGGGLVSRLVDVPGASRVVRGGVCTYATDTKASVLSVSRERLELTGPVDAEVAKQMASGARALFGADIALSTTGVAGPGSADGHEAGTVHVACAGPGGALHRLVHIPGDRRAVRAGAVDAALALLREALDGGLL